ncbi:Uncharacterized protein PBTT_02327 [Plasmodiophora brassicae]|uniref:Uncharacterized protein n=1 Tax=Plasmodiophora brassicae TaxID=37360 RepID=A0A0G4J5U7_PLABS|nr:hypothetical protein PBRA_002869 [Plasmodiophora brassicae]SPQ95007.1 unnamed protein product [Plasmodiophora brassicae]
MASWAEDIQAYQRKKQEAPATPAACVKSRKAKRPPAEYCIITQTFKDAGADERAREQESKSFVSAVNKAKDKAINRFGPVDIVSNQRIVTGVPGEPSAKPNPPPDTALRSRGYNIIVNEACDEPSETRPSLRKEPRDYDIITNAYHVHNDAKQSVDANFAMKEALEKYYKQNPFDIIKCEDRSGQQSPSKDHDTPKSSRTSQFTDASEGKLFDIINLKAIDPEQLKVRDAATEGRKAGRKLKYTFEKQNLTRIEQAAHRSAEMAITRVSHQRFTDEASRGYDIISNVPFSGIEGRPLPPPRTRHRDPLCNALLQDESV